MDKKFLTTVDSIVSSSKFLNKIVDKAVNLVAPKVTVAAGGGCATTGCTRWESCGGGKYNSQKTCRSCNASCTCTPWVVCGLGCGAC